MELRVPLTQRTESVWKCKRCKDAYGIDGVESGCTSFEPHEPRRYALRQGFVMKWIKWVLAYVFDCVHRHTTWPHRNRRGRVYVCCLDCGKELPYSVRRMSIVTDEEVESLV